MDVEWVQGSLLSLNEQQERAECERAIEDGLQTFITVGTALLTIRDKRLYRSTHPTFEAYCRERWGMARSRAYQLVEAAEVVNRLSTNVDILPANEAQARPLTSLEPEEQREVWRRALETAPDGRVTAAHVQDVVDEYRDVHTMCPECGTVYSGQGACPVCPPQPKPHVAYNSGNNEWYTPPDYIRAARRVMGDIDLDPASSEQANKTVGAATYFTAEDDGLRYLWEGRVWMNPPYSSELIGKFCAKLVQHVEDGDIQEAIVLVNNATDTAWFQSLLGVCSAVCFTRGRVRFIDMAGNPSGAPLQGQALLYFGPDAERFVSEFAQFGGACTWESYMPTASSAA